MFIVVIKSLILPNSPEEIKENQTFLILNYAVFVFVVLVLLGMFFYHFFMCRYLNLDKKLRLVSLAVFFCALSEAIKIPLTIANVSTVYAFIPFFLTHIFISIYSIKLAKFKKSELLSALPFIIAAGVFIACFILFYQPLPNEPKDALFMIEEVFICVYIFLLFFTLWRVTITLVFEKQLLFFFLGYVLFFTSDLIVISSILIGDSQIITCFIWITYLSANFLFSTCGTSSFTFNKFGLKGGV